MADIEKEVWSGMVHGAETVLRALLRAVPRLLHTVWRTVRNTIHHVRTTGQQSYRTLNQSASRTGAPLTSTDLPENCKGILRTMRQYGVDFAVYRDPYTGSQRLYYKTANEVTVKEIFAEAVKEASGEPRRGRLQDLMEKGRQRANQHNMGAEHSQPGHIQPSHNHAMPQQQAPHSR